MWKKIGSVHSGDDKSNRSVRSRSRDEFPNQSFHKSVEKIRANNSQFVDNQNTYFCHNHVEKKKRSDGNRSLSRIKTQKQLSEDLLKTSTIQRKHTSGKNHEQNQSLISEDKQQENSHSVHIHSQQKLKKLAKPSQLKQLRDDHNKLKEFVKFQISNFKKSFQDVKNQLKFQIVYHRQMTNKSEKAQIKDNLIPIVPYRFKSQILDSMNLKSNESGKMQTKKNYNSTGIINQSQLLGKIRNEAAKFIEQSSNQYQIQKNIILNKYKDLNLGELLA